MTEPVVLKAPMPRELIVLMGCPPVVLVCLAKFLQGPARTLFIGFALMLAVLFLAMMWWSTRRAIVLADDHLATRWVRRERIARAEVEGVEMTSTSGGAIPVVMHSGGQRTVLNIVASRAEVQRMVGAIRRWADVPVHPTPKTVSEHGEMSWHTPAPLQVWVGLVVLLGGALFVPTSLAWQEVPWWGWLAAAGLVAMTASRLSALRGHRVSLEGDELVVSGGPGLRVPAADIIRVVTVSRQNVRSTLLDLRGRDAVLLPTGDRLDERSALVQRWAEEHGGGAGSEEAFREPRNWARLARVITAMVCLFGCLAAALPVSNLIGAALFPLLLVVWDFLQPAAVVRDWSRKQIAYRQV